MPVGDRPPTQSAAITCVQIATMPKNSASEVNVAASSTTARIIVTYSPRTRTSSEHSSCYVLRQARSGEGLSIVASGLFDPKVQLPQYLKVVC